MSSTLTIGESMMVLTEMLDVERNGTEEREFQEVRRSLTRHRPIADCVEHRAGVPARVQDEGDLGSDGHAWQATGGQSSSRTARSLRAKASG